MTNEDNEHSEENQERRVTLPLSTEEVGQLALANDDEARAWMDANGVNPGDLVVVGDVVFNTDLKDFFTRDRQLSEALFSEQAAESARRLDIDTTPIAEAIPTPELAEERREVIVDELADEAIKTVEQEEGSDNAELDQALFEAKSLYERRVESVKFTMGDEMMKAIGTLENAVQDFDTSANVLRSIDGQRDAILDLVRKIGYGDRNAASIQTSVQEINEGLARNRGQLANLAENGLGDVTRPVGPLQESFVHTKHELQGEDSAVRGVYQQRGAELAPPSSAEDQVALDRAAQEIAAVVEAIPKSLGEDLEQRTAKLKEVVATLDRFINDAAYSQQIDIDALNRAVRELEGVTANARNISLGPKLSEGLAAAKRQMKAFSGHN